jgi:di/tricarboxylate transporter
VASHALAAVAGALAQATPDFETSPWPFIILFGTGFGIGVLGHLYGSRRAVALGIAIVFVATLILPIALSISN